MTWRTKERVRDPVAAGSSPHAFAQCRAAAQRPGRRHADPALHRHGECGRAGPARCSAIRRRASRATISSTRMGRSPRWSARTCAPGMRARLSGRARLTAIRARWGSRSTIPAMRWVTGRFRQHRCGPWRRWPGTSSRGTPFRPARRWPIPTSCAGPQDRPRRIVRLGRVAPPGDRPLRSTSRS